MSTWPGNARLITPEHAERVRELRERIDAKRQERLALGAKPALTDLPNFRKAYGLWLEVD